jgi:hypothetical protein
MPETVLERHYRDRVQSVRHIALPKAGHVALPWRDVEDLVALCSELSVSGRELLEKEFRRVFREPNLTVAWLRERRQVIADLSDNFLELAASIRATAYDAWQAAGSPTETDCMARLDGAIAAVAEAKQSVLERWPVGSDDQIAAARASVARGEGLDVDEAFAQIARVDVETWRQQLEECKRHRPEFSEDEEALSIVRGAYD